MNQISPPIAQLLVVTVMLILATSEVYSQATTLPRPSRDVYKCSISGKTIYSDSPCPGAEKVNVEPTQGLNKSSGKELIGKDVTREIQREQFANAVRPVTGMNPAQFEKQTYRVYMPANLKAECGNLDKLIQQAEAAERSTGNAERTKIQEQLYDHRRRYRELQC